MKHWVIRRRDGRFITVNGFDCEKNGPIITAYSDADTDCPDCRAFIDGIFDLFNGRFTWLDMADAYEGMPLKAAVLAKIKKAREE